jgi:hypothetical protein
MIRFKWCDGLSERDGQPHSALDFALTGHHQHCLACDVHLTSLDLCPNCGVRYPLLDVLNSELKYRNAVREIFGDATPPPGAAHD